MRRFLIVAGFVLVGVGVALFFSFTRTEVQRALTKGEPVHALLLLELGIPAEEAGPDLALVVSLLPQNRVLWLLVPGKLQLPQIGNWLTLKELGAQAEEELTPTLSNLWEAPFLATLRLSPSAWDALVEKLGGVAVRLEERLIYQDPFRQVFIDIPEGEHLLSGPKTREFLVYTLRYAQEPIYRAVLVFFAEFLSRLRQHPELLRESLAFPGLSPWNSRDFWTRAGKAAFSVEVLPLVMEDGKIMPDLVRTRKLRARVFTGRSLLTRDEVRLFLANGTEMRFLATRMAAWFAARGFAVVGVGNADRRDYKSTYLLIGPGGEGKDLLLRKLLPEGVVVMKAAEFGVERLGGWPHGADLVLILGGVFDVGT